MNRLTKGFFTLCIAAAFFVGCTARTAELSSSVEPPSSSSEASNSGRVIPPHLLEWAKNSDLGLSPELIARHSLPVADSIQEDFPKSYFIESEYHLHERQQGNSCSGHASAYLLRTLGMNLSGQTVYDSLDFKVADGLVLPQGILDYLDATGYPATLYQGNLKQLKARLSGGETPLIVLVGSSMEYQHYIVLLGYDQKNLYFFDSNKPENLDAAYNSVLNEKEFAKLWENIIPGFERIYIALD